MEDINKKFTFWCPLEKSEEIVDPTTGEKTMRLGGIASTSDEDSDGEFLDPKGFDIKPLMKSGLVNWHHQAKGQPSAIIGEPSKGEIRKDGLYLEVDLYPSSRIANEVFELAEILEKDSNTRRLGFSIEGKVLKRKSNDKNNPDYNHIEKAVITGVAVTHMPKNPKTFANIIKGEIDEELEKEEEENDENKALTVDDNGKPLKKESVDKNLKVTTFKKSEVMDRIFKDCAGITISKAEKIFVLIKNISKMKNRKNITEEDIEKAYETLGLDIEKGCCGSADGGKTKKFNKSEEEEEDEIKKKKNDTSENDDDEDVEEEDVDDDDEEEKACKKGEEEDDDDEEDVDDEKGVEKGGNRFDSIEKAISQLGDKSFNCMRALGVMLKDTSNELKKSRTQIDEMNEIIKGQSEEISELREMVEAYGDSTPAPKSLSHAHAVERRFNKADENDFGAESKGNENTVSMSRQRGVVSELLDQATFAKGGFDEEFSKACTTFEASHVLPKNIIQRMKNEFNVTIVE